MWSVWGNKKHCGSASEGEERGRNKVLTILLGRGRKDEILMILRLKIQMSKFHPTFFLTYHCGSVRVRARKKQLSSY